eukprot:2296718-Karenia_brevis.AAC.1
MIKLRWAPERLSLVEDNRQDQGAAPALATRGATLAPDPGWITALGPRAYTKQFQTFGRAQIVC